MVYDAFGPFPPFPPIRHGLDGWLSPGGAQPVDSEIDGESEHPVQNRVIKSALDGKVDKVPGMGLSANDFTNAEKTKLANIADGATKVIVDSALDGTSANPVQNAAVKAALDTKVDKAFGKGLSSNDFTTAEKIKLAGIENGANNTTVDSAMSSVSTNPVQNMVVQAALDNKVDKVWGKGLSANDYTTAEKIKLAGIDDGANKTVMDTALDYTSSNPLTNAAVCAALDNIIAAVDDVDDKTPPAGGTTGQVLVKNSNADYDYKWAAGGGGGGDVTDVQVAGTSVLVNGVANVPMAGAAAFGVVKAELVATTSTETEYAAITANGIVARLPTIDIHDNLTLSPKALPDASTTAKGAMSSADKAKLDGLHGVPSGGTTGQVLKKSSGTDYAVEWANESGGGGGGSVNDVTVAGTSVLDGDTAKVPKAKSGRWGVVQIESVSAQPTVTDYTAVTYAIANGGGEADKTDKLVHLDLNNLIPTKALPDASTTAKGAMSASDKAKLDGIASGATAVTVDALFTPGSTNPVQSSTIQAALATKVSDVTVNGVSVVSSGVGAIPAAGTSTYGVVVVDDDMSNVSTNPVQNAVVNGAIMDIKDTKQYCLPETSDPDDGAVSIELCCGQVTHITGTLTSLTVTLEDPADVLQATGDYTVMAHYHFDFVSGSTAPTLSLPQTVVMPANFAVAANTRYEIDILNGYACVMSWAVSS